MPDAPSISGNDADGLGMQSLSHAPEVTCVFLSRSLVSAPDEVFGRSGKSSHSVILTGLGAVDYVQASTVPSLEDDRRSQRLSVDEIMTRLQELGRRQALVSESWALLFLPTRTALLKALSGASPARGFDASRIDEAPASAVGHDNPLAAGHPVVHLLQKMVAGGEVSPKLASAIKLGRDEYLKQCEVSVGLDALIALLNAVRSAAALSADRSDSARHVDYPATPPQAPVLDAQDPGQSSKAAMFVMSRCCITRTESSDLRADCMRAQLLHDEDDQPEPPSPRPPSLDSPLDSPRAESDSQHASSRSASPKPFSMPAEPAEPARSTAAKKNMGSYVFQAPSIQEKALLMSNNYKSKVWWGKGRAGEPTVGGTFRKQFWDDFFAYREWGAVSRERALGTVDGAKARLQMGSVLPEVQGELSLEEPSWFSSFGLESSADCPSLFSSLQRLRCPTSSRGLNSRGDFRRRPADSTATPLQVGAQRARTAEARAFTPRHLPRIEPRAVTAGGKAMPYSARGSHAESEELKTSEDHDHHGRRTGSRVAAPPEVTMPMFMGAAVTEEADALRAKSPTTPWVSDKIGFNFSVARGLPQTPRAVEKEVLVEKLQVAGNARNQDWPPRCEYCRFHNIKAAMDAPMASWRQKKAADTDKAASGLLAKAGISRLASLFVGELHPDVTDAMLFEIFNAVSPVTSVRVCRDSNSQKCLGYGFVSFQNVTDANRALEALNNSNIKGRSCQITWSKSSLRRPGEDDDGICRACGACIRNRMKKPNLDKLMKEVLEAMSEQEVEDKNGQEVQAQKNMRDSTGPGLEVEADYKENDDEEKLAVAIDGESVEVEVEERRSSYLQKLSDEGGSQPSMESGEAEGELAARETDAAVAFGCGVQPLDASSGVYLRACERLKARPLARAAAALATSTQLADAGTGVLEKESKLRKSSTLVGHLSIAVRGIGLDDRGLSALLQTFVQGAGGDHGKEYVHVDLARNAITDNGLAEMFSLFVEPLNWARRLHTFDIAGNRTVTAKGLVPLRDLLADTKLSKLRVLRLGGIELMDVFMQKLLGSVAIGIVYSLAELDISFCGIGRTGSASAKALANLVQGAAELKVLDVSGNHLHADALIELGNSLNYLGKVVTLHVAHNSSGRASTVVDGSCARHSATGMLAFMDTLRGLKKLKLLDLRDSQVCPCGAFALSLVLPSLQNLDVVLLGGNAVGTFGLRALLSFFLTVNPNSRHRLSVFTVELRNAESVVERPGDQGNMTLEELSRLPVELADPSGSYDLDMSDLVDRAVCSFCLSRWRAIRDQWPFSSAFTLMTKNGKVAEDEIGQCQDGSWDLPATGKLTYTLHLPSRTTLQDSSGLTVGACLQASTIASQPRPQDRHRVPIPSDLQQRFMSFVLACADPRTFAAAAKALAADFFVTASMAATLLRCLKQLLQRTKPGTADGKYVAEQTRRTAEVIVDAVRAAPKDETPGGDQLCRELLDVLIAPEWAINTRASLARSLPGAPGAVDKMSPGVRAATMDFLVAGNPTGRYVLDLSVPSNALAAEYLLRVNAWEVELAKRLNLPDVSQTGNQQCFRNEALDAAAFTYGREWLLPSSGFFNFDFVVARRLLKEKKALPEDIWQKVLASMNDPPVPVLVWILCLRRISPALVISCQQAAAALALVAAEAQPVRQELLTVLFFRIRDYSKLWDPAAGVFAEGGCMSRQEIRDDCERALGRLNFVDPLRIQQRSFHLHLNVFEDRQLLRMLLAIAYSEGEKSLEASMFKSCTYGWNAQEMKKMKTPPEKWVKVGPTSGPPHLGRLTIFYTNEDAKLGVRKKLARQYCRWE